MRILRILPQAPKSLRRSLNLLISISLIYLIDMGLQAAHAQVTCRASVEYVLTREEGEKSETIVYSQEEASGDEEERVRQALARKVILAQQEALKSCKDRHENLSGCVASKYAAMGGLLQQMQFSARAQLQSAIEADCKKQLGRCGHGSSPEPTCVAPTAISEQPEEATEQAPEKKGTKK